MIFSSYITFSASFIVFYITCFHVLMHKGASLLISIYSIVYFEFVLYNILHSAGNIHWQTFLKGRLLFPTNYICWQLKNSWFPMTLHKKQQKQKNPLILPQQTKSNKFEILLSLLNDSFCLTQTSTIEIHAD